jgi:hypothetical protein
LRGDNVLAIAGLQLDHVALVAAPADEKRQPARAMRVIRPA